jgi:hypothetical protein
MPLAASILKNMNQESCIKDFDAAQDSIVFYGALAFGTYCFTILFTVIWMVYKQSSLVEYSVNIPYYMRTL